jgi:hypothetical protein
MKYFFLTEGWTIGRVWGTTGGLWQAAAWRREPLIVRLNFAIVEPGERLWLYQAEAAVLMVEVGAPGAADQGQGPIGSPNAPNQAIRHVILKRLMTAEQTIAFLAEGRVGGGDWPQP